MSFPPDRRSFTTTRWTLVLAASRTESSGARRALAELCDLYWPPIYGYARRCGYSVEDAQDLTQAFFTRLIEKQYVQAANPLRGRFRSFLLASFKHFLANEYDRRQARKRGGGWQLVALDTGSAEAQYGLAVADAWTPETLFERQWAQGVLDRVWAALRAECVAAGRVDGFDRLQGALTGEKGRYADVARELATTEGAIKVRVHRLRRRFRELLKQEVGATVDDDGEIDAEIRHLIDVLGRPPSARP
jgi:RNA polymerase sigma factor (sigma-70 family)